MYFRLIIFYIFIIMACSPNDNSTNTETSSVDTDNASTTSEAASSNNAVPLRSDIDDKYKWDMSAVYASEQAWEEDLNRVKELYPELANYKGKLLSSFKRMLYLGENFLISKASNKSAFLSDSVSSKSILTV